MREKVIITVLKTRCWSKLETQVWGREDSLLLPEGRCVAGCISRGSLPSWLLFPRTQLYGRPYEVGRKYLGKQGKQEETRGEWRFLETIKGIHPRGLKGEEGFAAGSDGTRAPAMPGSKNQAGH